MTQVVITPIVNIAIVRNQESVLLINNWIKKASQICKVHRAECISYSWNIQF